MTWRFFTADGVRAVDLLNNAIQLGPFPTTGLAIGGKTLVFTTPGATVTFPGAAGALVSLTQIFNALTVVADLHATRRSCQNPPDIGIWSYIALWRDGGAVIASSGTANALLGLSTSAATTVKGPLSQSSVKSVFRSGPNEYECVIGGVDADFDSPALDGGGAGSYVVVP